MRQAPSHVIATLGAAVVCFAALTGCSSSATWQPVPISNIPAAPAPNPPSRASKGGGLKPAAPPPKPASDDDDSSEAPRVPAVPRALALSTPRGG